MNTKRVIVRSVLSAVIFFGCIGIAFAAAAAAAEEELEVDFSPEVVANYIHAVIAAHRALYTTHIVDRLQEEGPGKFAGWIAPPAKGIYGQPLDFDYVRFN